MATTTNYGWTTPDDTALVKDGAAAIRTLGSSVDTTTKALNPSTTLGDIEYRSSTANTNTRLGIGTTGQILTVSGGVPAWTTPAGGGGKVLQVVYASYSTATTNTSGTASDTGLTATITPTLSTSKILVLVQQNGCSKSSAAIYMSAFIYRGATNLLQFGANYMQTGNNDSMNFGGIGASYLDSPATTSATTYKTVFNNPEGVGTITVQNNSARSTITLLEIGA
jgi:hypothetical protein